MSRVTIYWENNAISEGMVSEVVASVPVARALICGRAVGIMGWHVEEVIQANTLIFSEGIQFLARVVVDASGDEPALAPSQAEACQLVAEECAEVIKCATKVLRFGLRSNPWTGKENGDELANELGDVLAVLALLERQGIVDVAKVSAARDAKLRAWVTEPGRLRYASARGIK